MLFLDVHRRKVHLASVSDVIRRIHCAGDADVALITSRSLNVHSVAIQLRKCVHVSCCRATYIYIEDRLLYLFKYHRTFNINLEILIRFIFDDTDNWSVKAKRRKTTGTGRMRHLKIVRRKFK